MDDLVEERNQGLAWLESVEHLLQKDEHSSRAEAATDFTWYWS